MNVIELLINFLSTGIVVTIAGFILNRKQENFKKEIQKELFLHSQFKIKQHEIYKELYEAILKADGRIRANRGMSRGPSFIDADEQDIIKYLDEELQPTNQTRGEIIDLWEKDKHEAIQKIDAVLKNINLNKSRDLWQEALNILLFSKVYLSKEVCDISTETKNKLHELLLIYEVPDGNPRNDRLLGDEIKETLDGLLNKLVEQMKEDLTDSDKS